MDQVERDRVDQAEKGQVDRHSHCTRSSIVRIPWNPCLTLTYKRERADELRGNEKDVLMRINLQEEQVK